MVTKRQSSVGICAVYLLVFVYLGAQGNFLPLWLKSVGWSESQTGLVFSLRYIAIIIVPVFWGVFADTRGPTSAMRVISVGAAIAFIPLLYTDGVVFVTIALTVFSMFRVGIVAVADSLTLTHIEQHGGDFGRYRQWGSLGFIAGGFLLSGITYFLHGRDVIPMSLWGVLLLTIALAYWLPNTPPKDGATRSASAHYASMRALLKNPWMLRFLLVVFLWRLGSQGLYTMLPLHLTRLGVPESWVPLYWAIGVISEITMFRLAPKWFEPRGAKAVMTLCLVACVLQYYLLAVVHDRVGVAVIMLLHGLSFGMAYYTCVTWLGDAVEADIRAAGQGLFQVVAFGAGGAVSTICAGLLFERGGGSLLFGTAAAVACIALFVSLVALRHNDGWTWRKSKIAL